MFNFVKVFLYFIFLFLLISCGYDEKKHFPMPALDGLVVVIPFTEKVATGIKKTGQSKSYDESGDEVTDGSVRDDGYYQTGTAHDYGRDASSEIVFDRVTKLLWQDNSDAKTLTMSWIDAKNYCENLVHGPYSNWELPTVIELKSIIRYDKSDPSLDDDIFVNYQSFYYWTSTGVYSGTFLGLTISFSAWALHFIHGSVSSQAKDSVYNVRCVNRTFFDN